MLLELRNVDVVFDGIIQVLRSVNLDVRAGSGASAGWDRRAATHRRTAGECAGGATPGTSA